MATATQKYLGIFDSRESMADEFHLSSPGKWDRKDGETPTLPADFPTDDEIVVAVYEYEDYSGSAFVLFTRDGKIFEAHGSHCSCYGLEDQWSPEETSAEALRLRLAEGDYGVVNHEDVKALIQAFVDGLGAQATGYQGA